MLAGRAVELLLAVVAAISVALAALGSPIAGALVASGVFVVVAAFIVYVLRQRTYFDGPYRVLGIHCTWDLREPDASVAKVTKRLELEFNYETIALSDYAWGDGDCFAEYACEFGTPLKPKIKDGSRQYVVVALPAARQRGEQAELISHRTIRDSFPDASEWVELEVKRRTAKVVLEVRFPASRKPSAVRLCRQSDGRTIDMTSKLLSEASGPVLRYELDGVRKDDVLKLTWDWGASR